MDYALLDWDNTLRQGYTLDRSRNCRKCGS